MMNKKGSMVGIFVFIVIALVMILTLVILTYIFNETEYQLQQTLGQMDLGDTQGNNASVVIENTMGSANTSFATLHWISVFIIGAMIISIMIGNFLVTTKPVFLIPYLILMIIAVIVSVPIANTYEILLENEVLSGTFTNFSGANWIMLRLPWLVGLIGFVGAIILFSRAGSKSNPYSYYG